MKKGTDTQRGVLRKGDFKEWMLRYSAEIHENIGTLVERLDKEAEDRRESDRRMEKIARDTLLAARFSAGVASLAFFISVVVLITNLC